jgi:hypothetical protein
MPAIMTPTLSALLLGYAVTTTNRYVKTVCVDTVTSRCYVQEHCTQTRHTVHTDKPHTVRHIHTWTSLRKVHL